MQRNLILLFLLASVLPLIAVMSIGYYSSERSIVSMVERQTDFSAMEIERRFTHEFHRLRDQFILIGGGGGMLPPERRTRALFHGEEVEFYVDDLLLGAGLHLMYSGFVFLDAGGRPLYEIDYRAGLVQRGDRQMFHLQTAHFEPADSRGFEVSADLGDSEHATLFPSPEAGAMNIRLVTPLFAGGRRAGVLLGDIDGSRTLESVASEISLGKESFYLVVDSRSGVLLAHPEYSKRNQLLEVAMPGFPEGLLDEDPAGGLRFLDADGRNWFVSSRVLADTPWVISVVAPLDTFLGPIHRVAGLMLILVVLVLTAATSMIVLGTRRFRRSLATLGEAAERYAKGDLEGRVKVVTDDEMGALGRTFNRMASQLGEQIERREENARMESFNRLGAAVVHDLKGSLFSLSLLVENLDKHSTDPDFMRDSALTIQQVVERIRRISDRLSVRPTEAGLPEERVDLSSLLEKLLNELGLEHAAAIRMEVELEKDVVTLAPPDVMEGLFMNLLQNAVEAMPEGGTLRVTCRRRGDLDDGSSRAEVVVQDSGVGMPAEFLHERIFRPFSSTKNRGIGLGLYSCKQTVDRLGGTIEAHSEPGRGSRFTVILPAADQEGTRGTGT